MKVWRCHQFWTSQFVQFFSVIIEAKREVTEPIFGTCTSCDKIYLWLHNRLKNIDGEGEPKMLGAFTFVHGCIPRRCASEAMTTDLRGSIATAMDRSEPA